MSALRNPRRILHWLTLGFLSHLPATVRAATLQSFLQCQLPLVSAERSDTWTQLPEPQSASRPTRGDHETDQSLQDGLSSAIAFDPLAELRRALDVMQTDYFEIWVGTWPAAIDWTAAVIDTYLVSSLTSLSKALENIPERQSQADKAVENELNQYFAHNAAYYFGENAFAIRNEAFDDMEWLVLGWLESIRFIEAHSQRHYRPVYDQTRPWHGTQFIGAFAHRARVFYEITTRGWDTELCDGGMTWNPSLAPYKNTITNQLFISASVGMYLYFPGDDNTSPFNNNGESHPGLPPVAPHDVTYLHAAIAGYDWLANIGMLNDQGLYVDGYHISNWRTNGTTCDERNEMVYTYNQGVILSGLRGLWESTGNITYLKDGHQLVRRVMRATGWTVPSATSPSSIISSKWSGLGRSGLLEDYCDRSGRCSQDSQTFKGVFFHHLTLFCEPLPSEPLIPGKTWVADKDLAQTHRQSCKDYAVWVAHNARAALDTRDEKGRFGMWWGARDDVISNEDGSDLPSRAIDYRNYPGELLSPKWQLKDETNWAYAIHALGMPNADGKASNVERDQLKEERDLNDRGRGRTVETQGGGVSVLRSLWELLSV